MRVWSPQQETFLKWVRDPRAVTPVRRNGLLIAVAGAGKSTILTEAAAVIREQTPASQRLSVAIAVYNKPSQLDLDAKVRARGLDGKEVRAATFHSFGMSAVRRWAGDVKMDDNKMKQLAAMAKVAPDLEEFVLAAVSMAKQRAFGVLTALDDKAPWYQMVQHYDLEDLLGDGDSLLMAEQHQQRLADGIDVAIKLVRESNRVARELIDYDDMIYVPLAMNLKVWQNNWVMVDEAQDTNPARRALAKRMLLPSGRFVAVGDPFQAIYGFTGADNDSLDVIKRELDCVTLPLDRTYRCPKAVVTFARQFVDHIVAADSAPAGSVSTLTTETFGLLTAKDLSAEAAVLCRNTAPLVDLAFQLLRRKIPCHIEGRDIGAGLAALATKWKSVRTVAKLRDRLATYLEKETAKLMAKGGELKAASLTDRVESLYVVMSSLPDDAPVKAVADAVREIFATTPEGKDPANLTLATAHRSKGREWETVYLLGRERYMPSPFARQQWQQDQERNLTYVAITRAKGNLIEVPVAAPAQKR